MSWRGENFRPMPNMIRMTPRSASSARQIGIGGKAGRIRADQDAGQKIAHDRRNSQPMGEEAEGERRDDAADHDRYERFRFDHEPIQSSRQPRRTVRETTEKSNDQGLHAATVRA